MFDSAVASKRGENKTIQRNAFLLALVLLLLFTGYPSFSAHAASPSTHTPIPKGGTNTTAYAYYEYLPEGYGDDPNVEWPVVIFLHGFGQKDDGTGLSKLLEDGLPKYINDGEDYPFVVISPQVSGTDNYFNPTKVDTVVEFVKSHYQVDPDRVYLTGLSMGGGGVWRYAAAYPQKLAGIVPIAGNETTPSGNISGVPTWAFHNWGDRSINANRSINWVNDIAGDILGTSPTNLLATHPKINDPGYVPPGNWNDTDMTRTARFDAANGWVWSDGVVHPGSKHPSITLYDSTAHGGWYEAYHNPDLWNWLLSQTLNGPIDITAPNAPANLMATAVSSSQIDLSWTASADNVGVTGYRVYNGSGTEVGTTTTTSFSHTNLSASTAYTYTVKAYDAANNLSAASAQASATTLTASTPPQFGDDFENGAGQWTSVAGTASDWSVAAEGAGHVYSQSSATGQHVVSAGQAAWTDYQVSADVKRTSGSEAAIVGRMAANNRYYQLHVDGTYWAVFKNDQNAWTELARGTYATNTSNYNRLMMKFVGNRIQVYIDGQFRGTATDTSATPLAAGKIGLRTYFGSAKYDNVLVEAIDAQAPTAPANLSATAVSSSAINLTWTASTDNVGVTGYKVFRNNAQIATTTTTSYSDTGLSPSTAYAYKVQAYDAAGNISADSSAASAATPAVIQCDITIPLNAATDYDGDTLNAQPGDTVCIAAGQRGRLKFTDFEGTAARPITFINYGGKVEINHSKHALIFLNSKYFRVTGTGDPAYTYGIKVNSHTNGESAVVVGSFSTNYELDHIEASATSGGFAGFLLKTETTCDVATQQGHFTQYDTRVHHNYIHDVGGEGIYAGMSYYLGDTRFNCDGVGGNDTIYPHTLEGVRIYDNLVTDSGREGIQIGSATDDVEVYDNQVLRYGLNNVTYQDKAIEINPGTRGKFYNNLVKQGTGIGIHNQGLPGTQIFNNIVVDAGGDGIFSQDQLRPGDPNNTTDGMHFWNNTIINSGGDGIEVRNQLAGPGSVYNNLIVDTSLGSSTYIRYDGTGTWNSDDNLTYSSLATPQFVDAAGGNYRLQSGSPAVDPGTDLSGQGATFDFDGVSRPQGLGFDVGAFESH
ncbi:alpha/beta fold hydrolase [Cohnella sp. CFH 77786]|uniref:alpha/beta fold hydrolase n=1 Tax=Cohnella sp. CFH 77786 TaxID=2662265 RepID=UPI00271557BF|nr:alpha/beta fold hydrolase [Cohnella sp. CFH 77786]